MNQFNNPQSNINQCPANGLIDYSWYFKGKKPGPTITILGGIHGDESVGIDTIDTLISYLKIAKVVKGEINLVIGNVPAIKAGLRKLKFDMNRLFSEHGAHLQGPELERVRELEVLLEGTDLLLDLHSTIDPSTPFVAIPTEEDIHTLQVPKTGESVSKILDILGVPIVLQGSGLIHPDGKPIYTDSYTFEHGGIGMTVEAGWSQSPDTVAIQQGVINVLRNLGMLDLPVDKNSISRKTIWDAKQNVICANESFEFTSPWKTFDKVTKGTVIATHKENGQIVETIAEQDCMIVFPKKNPGTATPDKELTPGFEACILATEQ